MWAFNPYYYDWLLGISPTPFWSGRFPKLPWCHIVMIASEGDLLFCPRPSVYYQTLEDGRGRWTKNSLLRTWRWCWTAPFLSLSLFFLSLFSPLGRSSPPPREETTPPSMSFRGHEGSCSPISTLDPPLIQARRCPPWKLQAVTFRFSMVCDLR